jgi:hypothetical protein
MSPIVVPIAVDNVRIRYVTHNGATFLFILFALIIVKQLVSISQKYVSHGLLLVCVVSLLTGFGFLFTDSKLFKNRLLSMTNFSLTKQSLIDLREAGVPANIMDDLTPLKYQFFNYKGREFEAALDKHLDWEQLVRYRKQIFQHASVVIPYTTLPQVFNDTNYFQKRFFSLIHWLRRHYPGDPDTMKIMTSFDPSRAVHVLFYVNGGKKAPQEDHAISLLSASQGVTLDKIAEQMRLKNIDYFILANTGNFTTFMKPMLPLWENPDLASEWGLTLVHTDPNGAQVYSLQH